MTVKHIKVAAEDEIVNGLDWNNNHVTSNLATYELIEEKILSAGSTTFLFSGLNGNADNEYYLECDVYITAGSADRTTPLAINGSTSNFYATYNYANYGSEGYSNIPNIKLAENGWSKNGRAISKTIIKAKTGLYRIIESNYSFISNELTHRSISTGIGYWNDTSTNITSLGGTISGGSFEGTIRLYKKIPTETPTGTGDIELSGYELVERKALAAGTTTTTFSNLNGDNDEEYLIKYLITGIGGATDPVFFLRPNSASSGYNSEISRHFGSTTDATNYTDKMGISKHGSSTVTTYYYGEIILSAKTGAYRLYRGHHASRRVGGESVTGMCGGSWDESVTNITSLLFGITNGTFSGIIELYRKVRVLTSPPPFYLGYELVEEKDLATGTTETTFSGLDGDADGEYLIDTNVNLSPSGTVSYLKAIINNNTSITVEGVEHIAISDNAGHGYTAMTYHCLGRSIAVETTKLIGKATLCKKTGEYSYLESNSNIYGATYVSREDHNGVFRSTENITSIKIVPTTGSLSGKIRLWKKAAIG